jgi:hypothetical protein
MPMFYRDPLIQSCETVLEGTYDCVDRNILINLQSGEIPFAVYLCKNQPHEQGKNDPEISLV